MALLAIVLCVNFTACSKDDDGGATGGGATGGDTTGDKTTGNNITDLKGTTWKITQSTNDYYVGMLITFKNDETIATSPNKDELTYSQTGNTLTVFSPSENGYMQGKLSINGKTAIYKYKWYSLKNNKAETNDYEYMTLQKQ